MCAIYENCGIFADLSRELIARVTARLPAEAGSLSRLSTSLHHCLSQERKSAPTA
jgi:hypothetical protein